MKFLIASLGDFERWKEVKYRFGEETSVGPFYTYNTPKTHKSRLDSYSALRYNRERLQLT